MELPIETSHIPEKDLVRQRFDRVLYERLRWIFHDCRLTTDSQIKDFLRGLKHDTVQDSTIKLQILKREPILSNVFLKEELAKLSPLWISIMGFYHYSAKLLVCSGADVNEPYGLHVGYCQLKLNTKSTVLHVLLQMYPSAANERLIRLVMDNGADLQAQDSKGRTALHFAAAKGRVQMTELLLEKGVDVNTTDVYGSRPLLEAAKHEKVNELLPLLIEYGADVSARDKADRNVLHYLTCNSDLEHSVQLARIFIEMGVSLDAREHSTQYQPIHLAIFMGHRRLVTLFLDHGADVNAGSHPDEFPLYLAAIIRRDVYVTKTLLHRGANVNQKRAHNGRTTLHEACANFFIDDKIIELLLSARADVLVKDRRGNTPLALIDSHYFTKKSRACRLIVKKLALAKVCRPKIESKDEQIIEQYPELWNHYRNCIEQVKRTKSWRLTRTCSFFDLLSKCHCQITSLMRNPEFKINFNKLFVDLNISQFATYAEDIGRAFERAKKQLPSVLEQEDVINEAVGDILPYMVVRKMAHYYTFNCCEDVN